MWTKSAMVTMVVSVVMAYNDEGSIGDNG